MGGWPTIRYFNKQTGPAGGNYEKKTNSAMCDELGDEDMMTAYVEEYADTSLCNVMNKTGCSEKEIEYIDKMWTKDRDYMESQKKRLDGMQDLAMKQDLKVWLNQRKKILKSMLANVDKNDEL